MTIKGVQSNHSKHPKNRTLPIGKCQRQGPDAPCPLFLMRSYTPSPLFFLCSNVSGLRETGVWVYGLMTLGWNLYTVSNLPPFILMA